MDDRRGILVAISVIFLIGVPQESGIGSRDVAAVARIGLEWWCSHRIEASEIEHG